MSPILGITASQMTRNLNSYESIATVTVGAGGSASITFSSIPSTYKHLQIRGIHRSTVSSPGNNVILYMRFNGDTNGANYYSHQLEANGSGVSASSDGLNAVISNYGPRGQDTASSFMVDIIDILDYSNTSKYKVSRSFVGDDLNGSGGLSFSSSLWSNTAAVTSLTFLPSPTNFAQYSQLALYGIKG
jgi:hypothetical protein